MDRGILLQAEARHISTPASNAAWHAYGNPGVRILSPGRNLWRLENASRVAFLVDADAYFRCLEQSFHLARHSIWILGWDFNAEIGLGPGDAAGRTALGDLLRSLVKQHPELEIRLLIWQLGAIYSQKISNRSLGGQWSDHPRIHFRLDG